jgi:hypothetical protein
MKKVYYKLNWLIGPLLLFTAHTGCPNSGSRPEDEYLIRVGDSVLTVLDFNKAFEIAETAYPHNLRHEPQDLKNAQLRLLNQLTVEMIILERAEELNINVSDEEVANAVAEIKEDYPEGVFEETLLEFAVSYESWENRLRTRLIVAKVVDNELKNQIVITTEDITKYYEENFKHQDSNSNLGTKAEDVDEKIIKHLRRQKAENAYNAWLKKLKEQYPIEINTVQWEKITGSKYEGEEKSGGIESNNG